jgi:hypothetical protein
MVIVLLVVTGFHLHGGEPFREFLREKGMPPAAYVLSKTADHKVVILGENHWLRRDAGLVASLVPELRSRGAGLALEMLRAGDQEKIDQLIFASEWDEQLANEILRSADWPYVQYRDILHAAWKAKLRIVALGPPADFRALKIDYDRFMAERVMELIKAEQRPLVVYCGMHHAFTRYLQVERRGRGRATEFMTRFGNLLWRQYAQDVFLIALDKPEWCGDPPESRNCLVFGGAIECAAAALGRPVGFDIGASPVAEMKFPRESYYAFGHPFLRFIDYADGYIWFEPIERLRMVDVILGGTSSEALRRHAADLANPFARPSWRSLREKKCE